VPPHPSQQGPAASALSERQAAVLRAVVASYVGEAAPVGSKTISHLLPVALSSASVRNTLTELSELGLIEKPHASAGRVPTERGLRRFVDELCAPASLAESERRDIAYRVDDTPVDAVVTLASELLSLHTRQLGFVVSPRLDRLVLRHLSLVALSSERLLAVVITESGAVHRRVLENAWRLDQRELDRIAPLLNERVAGHTLAEVRARLASEAQALRREADALLARALEIGSRALTFAGVAAVDIVIETRLALFDQPEFNDPRRVRDLFAAVETKERLLDVLDRVLGASRVRVAFGGELGEPTLERCALVTTAYGGDAGSPPLGVLGVIGPSRMDFARVIPLVEYLSDCITGKLRS
jgi:heat-inducible transcriptional repressor